MKARHIVRHSSQTLLLLFVALLIIPPGAMAQDRAQDLFQQALRMERVSGDLEEAIRLYQQVVETGDRPFGARALIRMAESYEKLGRQGAQGAYARVIEEFGDQTEQVALARERLAEIERSLAGLNRQPAFRKIEIASRPQNGVLSPDGSNLAFVSEGGVWVVPLQGNVGPNIAGEPTRLTEPMGAHGIGLSWSANGEWIAFNADQEGEHGIFVIPATGGELTRIPGNHFRGANSYNKRVSLSPDGKTLAYAYHDPEAEAEASPFSQVFLGINTIPVGGGPPTNLTPIWSNQPAYSPDGRHVAFTKYTPAQDADRDRWYEELWMIPEAGGTPALVADSVRALTPLWSPDSRMIAFAEGQEIWVVPISEDGASAGDPTKIQLPHESYGLLAGWTSHDEIGVFMNAPTHQAVYTVPAEGGKAVQISPDGLAFHPRWTPDGKSIVFRGDGQFSLNMVSAEGGEASEIPIESDPEITPGVPGGGEHVSPDGEKIVFMGATWNPLRVNIFTLPIGGGTPTRVTESAGVPEMDTQDRYPCWSPDGDQIAFIRYRSVGEGDFSMNVYTVPAEGGEAAAITTDSDSVAWAAIGYSPDGEWLAYFTADAIKIKPLRGGEARVVRELEGINFHSELAWSPDGTSIAYTGPGRSIWTVPIDGGEPREVETGVLTRDTQNLHIDWSPDGTKITFTASMGGEAELWMMSGFLPRGH